MEILVKLFVGSQFLTETLLRNPDYLAEDVMRHRRVTPQSVRRRCKVRALMFSRFATRSRR